MSGPPLSCETTVELKRVVAGEAWLGPGQSNMEWRLSPCSPLTDGSLPVALWSLPVGS